MRTRDLVELLLLSLLWGAAYLFMRSAVPAFGPAPLVALRLGLAAFMLLPLLLWRGGLPTLRAHPGALLVLGIPFTALPFLMLAYQPLSDQELDAYIAFSTTPAGQKANRAVFAAFDAMFVQVSKELGQSAGRLMAGQDI